MGILNWGTPNQKFPCSIDWQVLDCFFAPKLNQVTGKDLCVFVCGWGIGDWDWAGGAAKSPIFLHRMEDNVGGGRVPRAEQSGVVKPDAEESAYRWPDAEAQTGAGGREFQWLDLGFVAPVARVRRESGTECQTCLFDVCLIYYQAHSSSQEKCHDI